MGPKVADIMANSVDPGQPAPHEAVWSGSTLFAQTCLSKSLGSLGYAFTFEEAHVKKPNSAYVLFVQTYIQFSV